MSRVSLTLITLTLLGLGAFVGGARVQPPTDPATRLPGARPVIDAARFATLQQALDALPAEGGMVQLPAGVFPLEQPLLIRSNDVCLVGAGTATHLQNLNREGEPAIRIEHPAGADNRRNELWRVRLTNFRITGNPQSGPGIHARHINELLLDALSVSENGGHGIWLDFCYEDARLCDCLITYNKKTGVQLDGCHDIVVSANQFEENQDALACLDGFNLTMTGNALDDHLRHGVIIENTYGSVVTGNMIEECQAAAIVLDRDCYGITLSANVIAHNGQGIDLRDAHGCSVSANTFTLMTRDALRIGPDAGRIAVSGNSFCNSYIGDGQVRRNTEDRAAAGMVLDGASDVGVTGNVFSSVRPKALEIKDTPTPRILFGGNVLTDVTSDHATLGEDSRVTDNLQ